MGWHRKSIQAITELGGRMRLEDGPGDFHEGVVEHAVADGAFCWRVIQTSGFYASAGKAPAPRRDSRSLGGWSSGGEGPELVGVAEEGAGFGSRNCSAVLIL